MKKSIGWLIITLAMTFFTCCETDDINCLRPSTSIIRSSQETTGFNSIISSVVGDIVITQDQAFSIDMEGPENVIDELRFELNNNELLISSDRCFTGNYLLTIDIHLPELKSAHMAGVGDLKSVGTLQSDYLDLSLTGVGDMDLNVTTDSLSVEMIGSGSVKISGIARKHQMKSTGEVQLEGYGLETKITNILSTGISNSFVYAEEELDVVINGTGSVYYKGSPMINSEISGTGKLINDN